MKLLLILSALVLWVIIIFVIILFLKGATLYDSDYFEAPEDPDDPD